MPKTLIDRLGLQQYRSRPARTPTGICDFEVYGMTQLTILGRDARVEVTEIAEGNPVLIGQVPLELLDFVVNPKNQRLIGNPDHGGQQMIDLL